MDEKVMEKTLFWTDDMDYACGRVYDFESEQEFIEAVKFQYWEYERTVLDSNVNDNIRLNVKKELCFVTEKGLKPESIIPVHLADVTMEEFYVAKVVDSNEDR